MGRRVLLVYKENLEIRASLDQKATMALLDLLALPSRSKETLDSQVSRGRLDLLALRAT